MDEKHIISVSEITRRIKEVLETGFTDMWVQGEISNCKLHTSGHLYFTLKDEAAQISAVMWRGRASQLLFRPVDGMKVIVRGNLTLYEVRGNYQIDCLLIQPVGVGELQRAFDQLKQKLESEGLFLASRKRPLPRFPERIGIVTSPTGAAFQDIRSVLTRRLPSIEVILAPVKVQGIGAAEEISQAIADLNQIGTINVIIVGRGGGSLEDLWAFNEEIVARAIAASKIPVVSAVGHEIDFSISDFVADLRAPTPSAAAEMVVREKNEIVELIRNNCYTIEHGMTALLQSQKSSVVHFLQSYAFNKPLDLLRQRSQQVDDTERRLHRSIHHRLALVGQAVRSVGLRLNSLNPRSVLHRGYAIIYQNKKIVSSIERLSEDVLATIELTDGTAESKILSRSTSRGKR